MLDVAREREVEGDLCLHDLGHGLPLRPGSFDGAISISAVQWLCNAVGAMALTCKSFTDFQPAFIATSFDCQRMCILEQLLACLRCC